jgi:hypothetical protein
MRLLFIALFAFINSTNIIDLHDAVTAKFHVIERGEVLLLEIEFDIDNYLKFNDSKNNKVSKEDFTKYLNNTTSWVIDNEKIEPKTLSIQYSGHHTKAICFLSESKKHIKSVQVKNEFLLDIKSHINIVMLDLNDTYKDYKLDKNRKEITVNYH